VPDLQFKSGTKYYTGPVKVKTNKGLFIMDFFGHRHTSPEGTLDRWAVPLAKA